MEEREAVKCHPTFYSRRGERWCYCTCGWRSRVGTANFVQVAFGEHLLTTSSAETEEQP